MSLHFTEVKKELANSLTHGIGFLSLLVGVPVLMSMAVATFKWSLVWSCGVFGFSAMLVYISSTLYHAFPHPLIKRVLQTFDHVGIYFLIAGSYTPFIIFYFNDFYGRLLLIVAWTVTILGTFFKIFFIGKYDFLSTMIYLAMGWMIVFVGKRLLTEVPSPVLVWLIVGGLSYSAGIFFYLWKKYKYHHAIWHLFVMFGTASHFIAIIKGLYIELHP